MEIGVVFLGFMVCFGGKGFWFLWLALGKRNSHFYCSPQARKRSEQWNGRSQRSFVFISEAFTWGIIFQAPEDQRKLQSSARISIGGDDPRCYCQNYFRVLFTCRAAGKRPTVRPLEVEAGERWWGHWEPGHMKEDQIWQKCERPWGGNDPREGEHPGGGRNDTHTHGWTFTHAHRSYKHLCL